MSELALEETSRRRRRRALALTLVPAVVVLLGATGFTTYILTREPTHLESIGCFDAVTLRANTTIVKADGRDPVAICADLWRQGVVGRAPAPKRLQACVLQTGAIGVFPSPEGETCDRLGIAELSPGYAVEGRRFARLRDAIVAEFGEPASGSSLGSPKCVGDDRARAVVRRELDAHGYRDWGIEVAGDGFTAERPCAEPAFDGGRKVVTLVPVAR